jgi:hypothetical protein
VPVPAEGLEDFGVEAEVTVLREAAEPLLAGDALLALQEAGLETNGCEVDRGHGNGARVLRFVAVQTSAVCPATPDRPAGTDERGGVEGGGAVDGQHARFRGDDGLAAEGAQGSLVPGLSL